MVHAMETKATPLAETTVSYTLVATATLYWIYKGIAVSRQLDSDGRLHGYLPGLYPGWLRSCSMDLSDIQWRVFRGNLPVLVLTFTAHAAASQLVGYWRPHLRTKLQLAFAVSYVVYLHGSWSLVIAAVLLSSFSVTRAALKTTHGIQLVWAFHVALLLGFKAVGSRQWRHWSLRLAVLDDWEGPVRWDVSINLLLLRCISFGCDAVWAASSRHARSSSTASQVEQHRVAVDKDLIRGGLQQYKVLSRTSLPKEAYCWSGFLLYALYMPCYLTGPTATYNAFAAQLQHRHLRMRPLQVLQYGVRWLACLLLLEVWSHLLYFNAVARFKVWQQPWAATGGPSGSPLFPPLQVATGALWVLVFMWTKFLVIWRLARLAAMADGMFVPENIGRCVLNNYDVEGFWRNWHCSFNLWLVRYLYVPMGGARWRAANMWPIFIFVALWHDLELRLLGWALMTCVAFAPELGVKYAAVQPWAVAFRVDHPHLFRHLAAALGSVNVFGLIVANMVGFVVGLDGVGPLLQQALHSPWSTLLAMYIVIHCCVLVMFHAQGRSKSSI